MKYKPASMLVVISLALNIATGSTILPARPVLADVPSTHRVDIYQVGSGTGIVTSIPAGIDCGITCSAEYTSGTVVTLTAAPGVESVFSGWVGSCTGTSACILTMSSTKHVTATFNLNQYVFLNVSKTGNGDGTVTSTPARIDCGSACSAQFDSNTTVTLTVAPSTGSTFTGWEGDCSGMLECAIVMAQTRNVTATFTLDRHTLTVSRSGNGSGILTSDPSGIVCGASCSASFDYGTIVTLTAAANAGSVFGGWTGGCAGDSCVLTMDGNKNIDGAFNLLHYTLTVGHSGAGDGVISSDPVGINCGTACSEDFDYGTLVTLTAEPATGSTFTGWSGACSSTALCLVTVDGAKNVTATFALNEYTLSVMKLGNGAGSVTSELGGIDCGTTCSADVAFGTVVTLTAIPSTGSSFIGWGGACSGTGTCIVTIANATNVTAQFTLNRYMLALNPTGNGSGELSNEPSSSTFDYGTVVTLTAIPATGSYFGGWSGDSSGSTNPAVLTIDSDKAVTATFTLYTYTLSVSATDNGTGAISSTPSGIDCGSTCSASYDYGTVVTLTAIADTGSTFMGWEGACSGTLECVVAMTEAKQVTATFTLNHFTLAVYKDGPGSGIVTDPLSDLECGTTCTADYDYGTPVKLTAVPATGSSFAYWTGDCTGQGECVVTVLGSQSVTATFELITADLSVQMTYEHSGGVITYTLLVVNSGPGDAPGAIVSDTLPVQLTNPYWACQSADGAACPANAASVLDDGFLYDTLTAFPAGGVVTYTITGNIGMLDSRVVNEAEVIPPDSAYDLVLENNRASTITGYAILFPIVYAP